MGSHNQFDYYSNFLNRSNHHPPTVPIDGISYHQYVIGDGTIPALAAQWFSDMDAFAVSDNPEMHAVVRSTAVSVMFLLYLLPPAIRLKWQQSKAFANLLSPQRALSNLSSTKLAVAPGLRL